MPHALIILKGIAEEIVDCTALSATVDANLEAGVYNPQQVTSINAGHDTFESALETIKDDLIAARTAYQNSIDP